MAPPRTTGDAEGAVRRVLTLWPTADDISRRMCLRKLGDAPEPGVVPYTWVKWQGLKLLRGEYHARYNALRRAVRRMEQAGELAIYTFVDTGQLAWIVPAQDSAEAVIVTNICNNGQAPRGVPP